MLGSVKSAAKRGARTVALSSAAALLCAVGLAFLTVAAWLALSTTLETVWVATIIGSAYFGIGLIALAFASGSKGSATSEPEPQINAGPDAIVQSFLTGLSTGQTVAARRR